MHLSWAYRAGLALLVRALAALSWVLAQVDGSGPASFCPGLSHAQSTHLIVPRLASALLHHFAVAENLVEVTLAACTKG